MVGECKANHSLIGSSLSEELIDWLSPAVGAH